MKTGKGCHTLRSSRGFPEGHRLTSIRSHAILYSAVWHDQFSWIGTDCLVNKM